MSKSAHGDEGYANCFENGVKVVVVLNVAAGGVGATSRDVLPTQLRESFAASGIEADVAVCEPTSLTQTAQDAAATGVDAVVAAGGDGTVRAVAAGLVGTDVPLAVLPLGTRNHFARDLGVPLDLFEAVRGIAGGSIQCVDIGEVNGQLFVNNSSIGLYPRAVLRRNVEQRRRGRSKWSAMLLAMGRVLRRLKLVSVHVVTSERAWTVSTPFVFVGNNVYETRVLSLGRRASLAEGMLSLYTVHCRGRLHLLWVLLRALIGRIKAVRDLESETLTEVWVGTHRRRLAVALDGEVRHLSSPLHYRVVPGALRVVVPTKSAMLRDAA